MFKTNLVGSANDIGFGDAWEGVSQSCDAGDTWLSRLAPGYPGDLDAFRFRAKAGQTLSLHATARELKPFIADGVPGWFEAMITLADPDGNEIFFDTNETEIGPEYIRNRSLEVLRGAAQELALLGADPKLQTALEDLVISPYVDGA